MIWYLAAAPKESCHLLSYLRFHLRKFYARVVTFVGVFRNRYLLAWEVSARVDGRVARIPTICPSAKA